MWAERSADESTSLPILCEFHHDQTGFLTEIKDTSRQKVLNIQVNSRMILHLYTFGPTAQHTSTHHHRHPKKSQRDVCPSFLNSYKRQPIIPEMLQVYGIVACKLQIKSGYNTNTN